MKEAGLSDTAIIGVYIFYNLIFALLAYPLGVLADKVGLKKILIMGIGVFGLVYLGFAYNDNIYLFIVLFAMYGVYAAATEGISKAMISNLVLQKDTAAANGTYSGFQSICTMFASALCGFFWYYLGSVFTFTLTAVVSVIVIIYFLNKKF